MSNNAQIKKPTWVGDMLACNLFIVDRGWGHVLLLYKRRYI